MEIVTLGRIDWRAVTALPQCSPALQTRPDFKLTALDFRFRCIGAGRAQSGRGSPSDRFGRRLDQSGAIRTAPPGGDERSVWRGFPSFENERQRGLGSVQTECRLTTAANSRYRPTAVLRDCDLDAAKRSSLASGGAVQNSRRPRIRSRLTRN